MNTTGFRQSVRADRDRNCHRLSYPFLAASWRNGIISRRADIAGNLYHPGRGPCALPHSATASARAGPLLRSAGFLTCACAGTVFGSLRARPRGRRVGPHWHSYVRCGCRARGRTVSRSACCTCIRFRRRCGGRLRRSHIDSKHRSRRIDCPTGEFRRECVAQPHNRDRMQRHHQRQHAPAPSAFRLIEAAGRQKHFSRKWAKQRSARMKYPAAESRGQWRQPLRFVTDC